MNMLIHKTLSWFFILIMTLALSCPQLWAEPGRSGWPIFQKAEHAASRGIMTTSPNLSTMTGLLLNGSLHGSMQQPTLLLTSELGLADDQLGGLYASYPLGQSFLAAGINYYNAGSIELNWLDTNGLQSETVLAEQDILGQVTYGRSIQQELWAGLTLKFASSQLLERSSAMAVAADLGALYQPIDNWLVAATLQNLGWTSAYESQSAPLPLSLATHTGYLFKQRNWHLFPGLGLAYNLIDNTFQPEVSLELNYEIAFLTVGYLLNVEEANWHVGLGIQWRNYGLNYSFLPGNLLNPVHRLNLSMHFGQPVQSSVITKQPSSSAFSSNKTIKRTRTSKSAYYKRNKSIVPVVKKITIKRAGKRIKLAWTKPASRQIYGYHVYMKINKGKYRKINKRLLKKTNYTSKPLKSKRTYRFKIVTINKQGKKSNFSRPKRISMP